MQIFYHVSPFHHQIGAIIPAGRFGQMWRRFVKNGGLAPTTHREFYELTWESVLETARRLVAPDAPSRLNCLFACTSKESAEDFRTRFRPPGTNLYRVEASDETPIFVGAIDSLSSAVDGTPFLDVWVETAVKYWTNQPPGVHEVLIGGPVTVVEKL